MTRSPHHSCQLYTKLSCTPPPKVIKKPLHLANYAKFANHFSISHTGKWNLQNLQRIAQNSPTLVNNYAKSVQSAPISESSLHTVVKLSKFVTFARFTILANFAHFAQMEINPGWSELSEICTIFLCIFMQAHVRLAPHPA